MEICIGKVKTLNRWMTIHMLIMEIDRAEAASEEEYWVVWFGDNTNESQRYVMAQLAKEFDEQDRALGMDAIFLEINDQSHSGYGVISSIELSEGTVTLEFDAQRLGLSARNSPLQLRCLDIPALFEKAQAQLSSMANSVGIEVNEVTRM